MNKYTSLSSFKLLSFVKLAAFCCSVSLKSFSADIYVTPNGGGSRSGANFDNAMSWANLSQYGVYSLINFTLQPGDTLYFGSGTYDGKHLDIVSSGTSTLPKRIEGRDTGGGRPLITKGTWLVQDWENGNQLLINFKNGGASHWEISGLRLEGSKYGVRFRPSNTTYRNIILRNLNISYVQYGIYGYNLDDSLIDDVSIARYTETGFYLHSGCDSVQLTDCVAKMSNGSSIWSRYSTDFVCGFRSDGHDARNTNISMTRCTSIGNRHDDPGSSRSGEYWNGDGFVAEYGDGGVTTGNLGLVFANCIALDNDDGGFDVKSGATFSRCVSFRNKRNYRIWDSSVSFLKCISGYPSKRGGVGTVVGIWVQNATVTMNRCTVHSDHDICVEVRNSSSVFIKNSILSFGDYGGVWVSGNSNLVTIHQSTHSYSPSSGVNPNYVNDNSGWNGQGVDFNSQVYQDTKGYFSSN